MFCLGLFASKFRCSNDFLCCDLQGGHNDCVGFFCVLSRIDTLLLEAGLELLDGLFCFASLIL